MNTHTTRSTPQRISIDKPSPTAHQALVQTSEAVRAVAAEAGLDRTLVELINLRVSQINGCARPHVHTRAALRAGETTQRLGVPAAWRDTELFTPDERAALALSESTTLPGDATLQESACDSARDVLTDSQISAVIWVTPRHGGRQTVGTVANLHKQLGKVTCGVFTPLEP